MLIRKCRAVMIPNGINVKYRYEFTDAWDGDVIFSYANAEDGAKTHAQLRTAAPKNR